jgi:superoxide reductase
VKIIKMTQEKEIYKCNVCGNVVQVIESGAGELVCCGQLMELVE